MSPEFTNENVNQSAGSYVLNISIRVNTFRSDNDITIGDLSRKSRLTDDDDTDSGKSRERERERKRPCKSHRTGESQDDGSLPRVSESPLLRSFFFLLPCDD